QFTKANRDTLTTVLGPLQEKIRDFQERVEKTHLEGTQQRSALEQEIKNLKELNTRISEGAENLTQALKGDNKTQGSWGEFVLESILERSGLVKDREYEVQVNLKNPAGGKSQPDVIVHLPESRDIIIDSKVSLKAWDGYCSADDDDARAAQLKAHVQSLRSHVKSLAAKDYQNLSGVNSLDYVFLFMPIEAAYSSALQADPELFQFAFERNIIFVVPTTLLTTLKTVQNLWRLAQQNHNAKEIAQRAGQLYDKFVAFVADLEEVGDRIDASRASYDKAHNKLVSGRGNLVRRTEQLKELGARTSKKHSGKLLREAHDDDDAITQGQELENQSPAD
ncbi:MAG: DNA recombination protein RmuC, partial [Gammaproteobacteria bacterium]